MISCRACHEQPRQAGRHNRNNRPMWKSGLERTCKPGSVPRGHLVAHGATTISLGRRSPDASSSRPGSGDETGRFAPNPHRTGRRGSNFFLLGLAPDGVYRASPVTRPAGELLPHRFTLTGGANPAGGLFSVALSLALRPVGVTHHRALRSPDFPPATVSPGAGEAHEDAGGRRSPGPLQSAPHHTRGKPWCENTRFPALSAQSEISRRLNPACPNFVLG